MITFQVKGYECSIDEIDADLLPFTWHIIKSSSKKARNTIYLRRSIRENKRDTRLYIHREIVARMIGRALEHHEQVDHIDMNGLNNCRSNLRLATKAENMHNTGKPKNNTSGFKGVSKNGKHGYMANITIDKRRIYLGTFTTPKAASEAYKAAAKDLFGEFANGG